MVNTVSRPRSTRAGRDARSRDHRIACLTWLGLGVAGTVLGLVARWPAQFGGAGQPSQIATDWMTKGTAVSAPLFMLVLMGLALGLLALRTRPALQKMGAGLASVVGTIAVVGSLGEVVAAPTADVPRPAQLSGVLGAAVSLAVVTTGLLYLRATSNSS